MSVDSLTFPDTAPAAKEKNQIDQVSKTKKYNILKIIGLAVGILLGAALIGLGIYAFPLGLALAAHTVEPLFMGSFLPIALGTIAASVSIMHIINPIKNLFHQPEEK